MIRQPSLANLGSLLKHRRLQCHLSLRDLADEIDVSLNTLSRVERGHVPDLANFHRILVWLDLPADHFFPASETAAVSTPAFIARHLRADPSLSSEGAEQIAALVDDMYRRLQSRRVAVAAHLRSSQSFTPEAGALLTEILVEMEAALRGGEADATGL